MPVYESSAPASLARSRALGRPQAPSGDASASASWQRCTRPHVCRMQVAELARLQVNSPPPVLNSPLPALNLPPGPEFTSPGPEFTSPGPEFTSHGP
eukprot:1196115-Prorocentrum_minimum.AAC.5